MVASMVKSMLLKPTMVTGTRSSLWSSLSFSLNTSIEYLRPGGTCIIFFDLWKITNLKDILEGEKFKQIRLIEWIKTNPQPINSKVNYLTNCREIALLGIKKSKPTFNSKYDKGIYEYPLQGGKFRFHPTQKSLPLFEDLIKKHSNKGDLVLDCFAGSGTTAIAARNTERDFIGCEMDETYYIKSIERIKMDKQTQVVMFSSKTGQWATPQDFTTSSTGASGHLI